MAHIVVIGSGIGGLPIAYKLRHLLPPCHRITVVTDRPLFTGVAPEPVDRRVIHEPFKVIDDLRRVIHEPFKVIGDPRRVRS